MMATTIPIQIGEYQRTKTSFQRFEGSSAIQRAGMTHRSRSARWLDGLQGIDRRRK
jgi:hypothetical protein